MVTSGDASHSPQPTWSPARMRTQQRVLAAIGNVQDFGHGQVEEVDPFDFAHVGV